MSERETGRDREKWRPIFGKPEKEGDTERKEEYKRVESGFSCVSIFISVFV